MKANIQIITLANGEKGIVLPVYHNSPFTPHREAGV